MAISRRRALKGLAATAVAAAVPLPGCERVEPGTVADFVQLHDAPRELVTEIAFRRSEDRGRADIGWLEARYTFSFSRYRDPDFMGFRSLRVLNEDRIQAASGFPMHGHRDMEIVTVVLDGGLEHRDNLGNGSIIVPGEVQKMSAGRGIRHSEVNPSSDELVHLLQIWMEPDERGIDPYYDQRTFAERDRLDQLRLVADSGGDRDAIPLHTDARLMVTTLSPGGRIEYENRPGRHVWLQVARGDVAINGMGMVAGDGAAISQAGGLLIEAPDGAELLLFDLG